MTDQDHKAARREIADALLKALERRHEIADVVVESEDKAAAVEADGALFALAKGPGRLLRAPLTMIEQGLRA